jgi:hypothetical protein
VSFQFPEIPVATYAQLMSESSNISATVKAPERCSVVFQRQIIVNQEQGEELGDDFFELTVNEAKKLQKDLSREA